MEGTKCILQVHSQQTYLVSGCDSHQSDQSNDGKPLQHTSLVHTNAFTIREQVTSKIASQYVPVLCLRPTMMISRQSSSYTKHEQTSRRESPASAHENIRQRH